MPVMDVTTDTFRQEVLESEVPVVVDFHADWCGPCHQLAPVLKMLAEEHDGTIKFTKVNIDEEPELAQAYRISSIPAVLLFDAGAPTAWSLGPKPGYVLERELGLTRAAKKAKKRKTSGDAAEQEGGLAATVKSWWSR